MANARVKTPRITWLKEVVTAGLGVLIVVGTFLLLWSPLTRGTPDIQTAQAIFSIVGGWGGVVLGYYFGRLPAERVATKAEAAAVVAEAAKDVAVTRRKAELTTHKDVIVGMEETLETYKKKISDLMKRIAEL